MGIWYTTREDVKSALDIKETARANAQIDRAIEAASRSVEGLLHRRLYPEIATRYFDWPNQSYARSWRLWLDDNELISASSVTSAGVALQPSDYFLEPANYGPPFDCIELDRATDAAWDSASTPQRSIAISGTFGFNDTWSTGGTATEAMDAVETGMDTDASASRAVGIGSLIKVDSEVMIVTDRQWLSFGQTLSGNIAAQNNVTTVPVGNGALFSAGETILIDSEKMLVTDVAGNSLIVKRSWDGTTLAAHTSGATVYAPRTLTVVRGALGTTAATHSTSAAITVWEVPGLAKSLCTAEALNIVLQEQSGYARVSGAGDNTKEYLGRSLNELRKQAVVQLGRRARSRAV